MFKYPKRIGYPITLSVEPTANCNLECPQCPTGMGTLKREQSEIDFKLFKKITDEAAPHISAMILYFMGEPYMSKDFLKCVRYASKEKNIYTISSTNAHFLTNDNARKTIESGLDELIISIDGITQSSYEQYRKNGNLNLVKKNTENLIRIKKEMNSSVPKIIIQVLHLKSNQNEIEELRKYSKRIGADRFELKSAQFYDYKTGNNQMPDNNKKVRYKQDVTGNWKLKSKLKNRCLRLWETSVITWDGKILPCCFDKDAEHSFGNISTNSFKAINNNNKAVDFRKRVLKNKSKLDTCRNCSE